MNRISDLLIAASIILFVSSGSAFFLACGQKDTNNPRNDIMCQIVKYTSGNLDPICAMECIYEGLSSKAFHYGNAINIPCDWQDHTFTRTVTATVTNHTIPATHPKRGL